MKSLRRWHQVQAQQVTRRDMPRTNSISRSPSARVSRKRNAEDAEQKSFIVGETEVGGKETVG